MEDFDNEDLKDFDAKILKPTPILPKENVAWEKSTEENNSFESECKHYIQYLTGNGYPDFQEINGTSATKRNHLPGNKKRCTIWAYFCCILA